MIELDISLPEQTTTIHVKRCVQFACDELGLTISMETSLASYPGSVHWHIKNGKKKGTLELTTWPGRRPLWAKVQTGRRADWIEQSLPELCQKIQHFADCENR